MDNVKVQIVRKIDAQSIIEIESYQDLSISEMIEVERQLQNNLRFLHTAMYKAGM